MLTGIAVALYLAGAAPAFATVGERHPLANLPSAVVRDAEHRRDLRITIWYPSKAGSATRSIDFPPDGPLFQVGEVALDAPFLERRGTPPSLSRMDLAVGLDDGIVRPSHLRFGLAMTASTQSGLASTIVTSAVNEI
ncbi:hypothetical protein [Mesorhizobium sp. Cs1299R1N3]|uniref:hypothetical protein n=1 Tax=Mesorhizobium sp. Cs1299R1N3 TaxID=3015173 RepID=UPI00301CAD1F